MVSHKGCQWGKAQHKASYTLWDLERGTGKEVEELEKMTSLGITGYGFIIWFDVHQEAGIAEDRRKEVRLV